MEVVRTNAFSTWLDDLRDRKGRGIIIRRLERLAAGNRGDVGPVGGGVSELRIHYGPGYRVYFVERGTTLTIVLWGGAKSTQDADIKTAIAMSRSI